MKHKKLNIFVFLSIMLFLSISTFSIGVTDTSTYITRSEFDNVINNINAKINNIESIVETKIVEYFANNELPYEGGPGITLEKNITNNKFTIKMTQPLWSGTPSATNAYINCHVTGRTTITGQTNIFTVLVDCYMSFSTCMWSPDDGYTTIRLRTIENGVTETITAATSNVGYNTLSLTVFRLKVSKGEVVCLQPSAGTGSYNPIYAYVTIEDR